MKSKPDYKLYLVTDSSMCNTGLEDAVTMAIKGGVTTVQLREKNTSTSEFYSRAVAIREITAKHGVTLIINDRLDIAQAVGADGVHLGPHDLPVSAARRVLGDDFIIGASAREVETAIKAYEDGADYLGVGAVFGTSTKNDAEKIELETLSEITKAVPIPVVAIGGINLSNIGKLQGAGIAGVAVVSAIMKSDEIEKTASEFHNRLIL